MWEDLKTFLFLIDISDKMSLDKFGLIKGFKYGFVVGLVALIIGGVANTAFGVPLTGIEFGAIGFGLGLAEGLLE